MNGECKMRQDKEYPGWDGHEKDLSVSLAVHWSRKRKRWESGNAYFWLDGRNKWSCRSEDGKYYHGFRSLKALLKSYVGGLLCEKARNLILKDTRTEYYSDPKRRRVFCRVTMRCVGPMTVEL